MSAQVTVNEITGTALQCAFRVSNALGFGFLEKVYENALALELESSGLVVTRQQPVEVRYRDAIVGVYVPDIVLNDAVVLEIKAIQDLDDIHVAQCINYLRATGHAVGLILNFGRPRVQYRRVVRNYGEGGQRQKESADKRR